MNKIIYVNAYTGQQSTGSFRNWDFPPWLKGEWFEHSRKTKLKHTYIYMGKMR